MLEISKQRGDLKERHIFNLSHRNVSSLVERLYGYIKHVRMMLFSEGKTNILIKAKGEKKGDT